MLKKISILLIACNSCAMNENVIFYTHNVKKCVHNLEQIESWIHHDIANGKIPVDIGEDYMIAITHTKISLQEKYKKYDK